MFVDSTSAIQVAEKKNSRNCRQVEIPYRVAERAISEGRINLQYLSDKEQLADILTKALVKDKHEKLVRKVLNLRYLLVLYFIL